MGKSIVFTDTHAHLDMLNGDEAVENAIKRANDNGVVRIISVADTLSASYRAVELAEKFDQVYAAVGIHPHEAKTVNNDTLKEIKKLASHDKVVAIGEIGLDYFKNRSPQSVQRKVFEQQLDLAIELDMPVIIHDRDADSDTLKILDKHKPKKGVFHCFSSSVEFAQIVLSLNYYISFAGPVTFKNAGNIIDVVKFVPLTKLLIETDSPFLTPHPHRGKKNEPQYVRFVAEKIAEIKGITTATVSASTQENVSILFGIK